MRLYLFSICAILLIVTLSVSPSISIMRGMGTSELTSLSDLVIRGNVESVQSYWSSDHTTIITQAVIVYNTVIRGTTREKKITVEYEGGEVGDTGLRVSDSAEIKTGEDVVLFLKGGKSRRAGQAFRIVGKAQGKYTVGSDGIARKKGFSVIDGQEMIDNNIPVQTLMEKIRKIK